MTQLIKNQPVMQETWVQSLGWEDPLEKGKVTHSSILGLENSMDCTVSPWGRKESDTTERLYFHFTAAAKSLQSCLTLWDPIEGSPPGSPIPGILQARTLEWVAISFSNAWKWKVKSEREVAQSYPTLSNPMDCSLPGSSVHGIFQARVLEWV